ncbi:hypothetical protein SEA_ALSABER_67 [Streptomyces phage Alsaber]|uniref:Lipoprotein n=1 Tax=Streptomyces phage Alsaber TaxID=2053672 RepID=A0A2H4PGI1_9CAUD|nr:hypothetical protein KGG97_gp67 [Streptomyces phage Alsaber]ATW61341.1 hypothetical protein SEA_ALSABER_67 [Streptomyces phage Alsaber]
MRVLQAGSIAILVLLASILLVGCDDRPCESGHYNYIPIYHSTTKTTTITPVWVCDQYAEEK